MASGDTVTLSDKNSSESVDLRRIQRIETPVEGETQVHSPPGLGPADVIITVLGERERVNVVGLVTGPLLATQAGFSSDWKTALAEYVQTLEAFAYSRQFEGYTLTDNNRSRTIDVVCTGLEWQLEAGAIYQISYELTLERAQGALPDADITSQSITKNDGSAGNLLSDQTSPGGNWILDGNTLAGFRRISVTREFGAEVVPRAFAANAGENDAFTSTAAPRVISFRGVETGSKASRNSFDDTLSGLVKDATITLETNFPGYRIDGVLMRYEPQREASYAGNRHQYEFTFHEGKSL